VHKKSVTIPNRKRLSPEERTARELLAAIHEGFERPKTRGDCVDGPRPCPWVSCKHHLYLDVRPNGSLVLNFPDKDPGEIEPSCALDVADYGGATLKEVAEKMNFTRERARQVESVTLTKMRQDPVMGLAHQEQHE